ncbi:hypothetical protein P1X14_12340 [Sphingomonas sp. AOB5]|uniref:hypothetical protein n=1 Tax=Sphingomonas sp. AOB5 TaxID=3034017 RepID=UPI0023F746B2|nr:hypothetical protein [Sphingomonas sp. AOB5]MDF7776039.1 hypothetical protein [Sphingomonas sp. AOB5]
MSSHNKPWEPDPRSMGNWRAMFEGPRGTGPKPAVQQAEPPVEDEADADDLATYKPWLLQRGRSRSTMMLDLRRYDPRSGFWQGWAMPYASLQAIEYVGDGMLSLDFGSRIFMVEGDGLDELLRPLQQGLVLALHEYNRTVWPERPAGACIATIRRLGTPDGEPVAAPGGT